MIQGGFTGNIPFLKIGLTWGGLVQTPFAVLDTGFTGDLQVTPLIAKELRLEIIGVIATKVATGQIMEVPVAAAVASMEGSQAPIEVLISESIPLVGINFLTKFGYKATVDCKNRKVFLERVI